MRFKDIASNYKVWLDLSTFCNASCPQCHRTNTNGLGKEDWLPLVKWSLDDFTKKFPKGSMDSVFQFDICGTWGDPVMSKDIGKISKYIIDNSNAKVHINTNGGLRTPEWWEDLGNYCKDRLTVYFDVDGINNQMHQKYRRGVDLQTVLDNMEALSCTPAIPKAFVILFKHNQNYAYEIIDMCKMYGAKKVMVIKSDRFLRSDKFKFTNEDGEEELLESITRNMNHIISNGWISRAEKNMNHIMDKKDQNALTKLKWEND